MEIQSLKPQWDVVRKACDHILLVGKKAKVATKDPPPTHAVHTASPGLCRTYIQQCSQSQDFTIQLQ